MDRPGSFVTQDTWKGSPWQPWTQNLYVYTHNNPVNFVDPTGHKDCDVLECGYGPSEIPTNTSLARFADQRLTGGGPTIGPLTESPKSPPTDPTADFGSITFSLSSRLVNKFTSSMLRLDKNLSVDTSIKFDKYGNVYTSFGFSWGRTAFKQPVTTTVSTGWVEKAETESDVESGLSGLSASTFAVVGEGYQHSRSIPSLTGTDEIIAASNPGAGVSVSFTVRQFNVKRIRME